MEILNQVTTYLRYLGRTYKFKPCHMKKPSYATYGYTYPSYKTYFFLFFFSPFFLEAFDFHADFQYAVCFFLWL